MPRLVRWIWILFVVHMSLGMAAYLHFIASGSYRFLSWYFWIPGTLFFLLTTTAESLLALQCRAGFEPDEPMRLAWSMIALAAMGRVAGTLLIAARTWHLSWITGAHTPATAAISLEGLARTGAVVGGPLSMTFLAIGLARVLSIQRRYGLLGGLTRFDKIMLGAILLFTLSQIAVVLPLISSHPPLTTAVLWSSDPLLALLLIEAVLVRRSMLRIGRGLIAQGWGMYVVAVVATSLGDAAMWATSRGYLANSLTALSWYIWFAAAAAFASAPAYQLAAMSLPLTQAAKSTPRSRG